VQIKLFVKDDCPRCPAAKNALEGIEDVQIYNVDELDGLTEATFHGVLSTPSVLLLDSSGFEVFSWRGTAPDPVQLRSMLAS